MSSATVTPSLVTLGTPQPLSSTALRPRGPSVLRTALASFATPANNFCRASSAYASCFAAIRMNLLRYGFASFVCEVVLGPADGDGVSPGWGGGGGSKDCA